MASDLEALFEHYRSRGLSEEEALRRSEEKVLASPAQVNRLVEVHASGAQRWIGWLFGRVRRDLDLFLFVVGVIPVLALAGIVLIPRIGTMAASPFLWGVLGTGAAISALSLVKAHHLFLRGDTSPEALRAGLPELLFLGAMASAVGCLGFLLHVHTLAMGLSRNGTEGASWASAAAEIEGAATLLGTGILLAIGAGLLWFILASRLAALERAERVLLLGE